MKVGDVTGALMTTADTRTEPGALERLQTFWEAFSRAATSAWR